MTIMGRINRFNRILASMDKSFISQETEENSMIAKDFLIRYNIVDNRCLSFLIQRFITVSFPDPYPQDDINILGSVDDTPDDLKLPENPEDRVYPDSRYHAHESPFCIYIPCREVMLKLMRACIKVKDANELWVMKNRPPERGGLANLTSKNHCQDHRMDAHVGAGHAHHDH